MYPLQSVVCGFLFFLLPVRASFLFLQVSTFLFFCSFCSFESSLDPAGITGTRHRHPARGALPQVSSFVVSNFMV